MRSLAALAVMGLAVNLVCSGPAASQSSVTSAASTNLPIKQTGSGVFEIGQVRLDKNQRTVRFPAAVNQTNGAIEYLIVTSSGKTHESLLRTDAEPYHIQLAFLLLGAKGAGTNSFPENNSLPLPGEEVEIELERRQTKERAPAEDFVYNLQSKSPMTKGPWIYNGSRVLAGTFTAQQDGSIVSVMVDQDALINNPRPGRENDKIWQVSSKGLPPLNSPVWVIIRLKPAVPL